MKELSVEEKAKAYDEAKARMSRAFNSNRCTLGFMNEIFPELAKPEDEKVRKTLIILLQHFCKGYRVPGLISLYRIKKCLLGLKSKAIRQTSIHQNLTYASINC